ncbi:MAG: DUF5333 domain-containing protein [Paracoccaceae bacterium]
MTVSNMPRARKRRYFVVVVALLLGVGVLAAPVRALPSLADDDHITLSLVSAAAADTIRKGCSSLNARLFRALRKAKELERYATGLGFSKDEIKAFIGSRTQRLRIETATRSYLVENGVVEGQEATYCSLGRVEMKKGSLIGQLLWSW